MEKVGSVEIETGEHFLTINEKTNTVYVANNKSDSILVIGDSSKKILNRIEIERPRQLVVNSDNNTLYSISDSAGFRLRDNGAKISIIDTTSNQITGSIGENEGFGDIKLNQDTNLLYATQTNSKKVWIIDTLTNTVTEKVKVGAKYRSITIDNVNNTVYLGGRAGWIDKLSFAAIHGGDNHVETIVSKTTFSGKKVRELYYNQINKKLYALIEETGDEYARTWIYVIDIESKSFWKKSETREYWDRIGFDQTRNRIYFSNANNGEFSVLNDSLEKIGLFRFTEPQSFVKKYVAGIRRPTKIAVNSVLNQIYLTDGAKNLLVIMKD